MGTTTFTNESASGWQQMAFPTPIAIAADTTYVISCYAVYGHYSAETQAFNGAGVDRGPLHALADGVDGPNGVYRYSVGGLFPFDTYNSANYFVDVVFEPAELPASSTTVAGGAAHSVILTSDGTVWTVGSNAVGQLGDGTYTTRTTPVT